MSGIVDAIFGGGEKAPDPNPGLIAQANSSAESSKEYAQVAREQLAWSKELAQKQLDVAAPIIQQQAGISRQQMDIASQNQQNANEQWNYYKQMFQPVEQQTIKDAMGYDSEARKAGLQTKAAQDIAAGYDANTGALMRNATRYGGSATSPAMLALESSAGIAKARDTALAKNAVVQGVDDKAIALRSGAANFGRNMPNTASNAFSTSINAGNAAVGAGNSAVANSNATGANAINMTGGPANWAGAGINAGNSAMSGYGADYSGRLSGYNANLQADAALWGGLGQAAGMWAGGGFKLPKFAKGGVVHGPGTETSDSIPAKLSDGEGVLNAPAVQMLGEGFVHAANTAGLQRQDSGNQMASVNSEHAQADPVAMGKMVMMGLEKLNKKVDRLSRGKVGLSRVSMSGGRDTEPRHGSDDEEDTGRVIEGESMRMDDWGMAGLMPIRARNGATPVPPLPGLERAGFLGFI